MVEDTGKPTVSEEKPSHKAAVELKEINRVLQLYALALSGTSFQVVAWPSETKPEGRAPVEPAVDKPTLSLPQLCQKYATLQENLDWYKAAATHQVGHWEFGTFEFSFEKEARLFDNRRFQSSSPEVTFASPIRRFFSLFDNRKLAAAIFAVVEDIRVDFMVKEEYTGLRKSYSRVLRDAILARPALNKVAPRHAYLELLVRMGSDVRNAELIPDFLREPAQFSRRIIDRLGSLAAAVEDSAEATILLYEIAMGIPEFEYDASPPGDVDDKDAPAATEYSNDLDPDMIKLLFEIKKDRRRSQGIPLTGEEIKNLDGKKISLSGVSEIPALSSLLSSADLPRNCNIVKLDPAAGNRDKMWERENNPEIQLPPLERLFLYDEWDFRHKSYLPRWCCVREKTLAEGSAGFFDDILATSKGLAATIKQQFELLPREELVKAKMLDDGDEIDLDMVIEEILEKKAGMYPAGRVYCRKKKMRRDVSVVFLIDMSGSTADLVSKEIRSHEKDYDFMKYVMQPKQRIIDVEKEGIVLLINAIDSIGDRYGIYGFSGHGRENIQFLVIKDIDEGLSDRVRKRVDMVAPIHGTRMGPALRHATSKLAASGARTKILFLLSDGYPQDKMYGKDDDDREYAVNDTRAALLEATERNIIPFCLTVDVAGHDYLKEMCTDIGYNVLDDINELPLRLPLLYRKLSI